jgi:hypothetical protein
MKRLFVRSLKSIGAVDEGDNPGADIVFYKRKEGPAGTSQSASADSVDPVEENRMTEEVIETVPDEEPVAKAEEEVVEEVEKAEPVEVDEITKRDEEIAKLRADLEAVQFEKRTAEWVEKAKPLEDLLGDPAEIGAVLRDLDTAASEALAKLLGPLTAAAQRAELGAVFVEKGVDASGEVDPISKRDQWVEKHADKYDNVAAARADYWRQHPDEAAALREK